jgi:hypothetical protein
VSGTAAAPGVTGASDPDDRHWRVRHLRLPLIVTAGAAVVAAVVGGLVAGPTGAAGAAAGVLLVMLGYVVSTLLVAWADATATALVMPVGMMAYVVKITVVGAVLLVAAALGWSGLVPMAWGVAVGVAVWIATHIWWLARGGRSAAPR